MSRVRSIKTEGNYCGLSPSVPLHFAEEHMGVCQSSDLVVNIPKALMNKKKDEVHESSRFPIIDDVLPNSHDRLPTPIIVPDSLGLHSSASLNEKLRISVEDGQLL